MWNWLMTGGVEVDWAIGIGALLIFLAIAALIGYVYGFEEGFDKGLRRNGLPYKPKHFDCRSTIEPFQEEGEDSSV